MKDLNDKITGGTLPASEWNEVPSELQNVIEKTGQVLTSADLDQIGKGIAVYAAGGDFYTDSGAADAYVLSAVGSKQSPPAYFNGMKIRFLPSNANTGPATVNVATLGVKSLVRTDGNPLVASDMQAGVPYSFQYDIGSGKFLFNGESLPDASESIKGKIEIATQTEVNTGTDDVRAVTALKLKDLDLGLSKTEDGYITLPGGIIIQWMTANESPNSSTFRSFPMTFPNAVLSVTGTPNDGRQSSHGGGLTITNQNTSGCVFVCGGGYGTSPTQSGYILAIGH